MLCMFGNDFYVKKGDVLRIEIARISERYLFAVSEPGGSRSDRLVLVYNSCGLAYEISTFKDDESDAVYVFGFSYGGEYNLQSFGVGWTVRAEHVSDMVLDHHYDYVVDVADDTEDGKSAQARIREFTIPCYGSKREGEL